MPQVQPKENPWRWCRAARDETLRRLLAKMRTVMKPHAGAWEVTPADYSENAERSDLHVRLLLLTGKADGIAKNLPASPQVAHLARAAALLIDDTLRRDPRKAVLGEPRGGAAVSEVRKASWDATRTLEDAITEWQENSAPLLRELDAHARAVAGLSGRRDPNFLRAVEAAAAAQRAVVDAGATVAAWREAQQGWYDRHGGDDRNLTRPVKGKNWLLGQVLWTLRGEGAESSPFTHPECLELVDDGEGEQGKLRRYERALAAWVAFVEPEANVCCDLIWWCEKAASGGSITADDSTAPPECLGEQTSERQ